MINIRTFGDSHSVYPWQSIQTDSIKVQATHLGPKLMYSIGRDGLDLTRYNLQNGDIAILCFGEIDCRCHVNKYGPDYKTTIKNIVDQYIKVIDRNAELLGPSIKLCLYNVVPPVRKDITKENPTYPFLGTDTERRQYVIYMNSLLKAYAKRKNYIYFDVYDKYCDPTGYLSRELSDRNVHLKDTKYLIEAIHHFFKSDNV